MNEIYFTKSINLSSSIYKIINLSNYVYVLYGSFFKF